MDLVERFPELNAGIIRYSLPESLENLLPASAANGQDERKPEPLPVAFIQILKFRKLLGRTPVQAGTALFRSRFGRQRVSHGEASREIRMGSEKSELSSFAGVLHDFPHGGGSAASRRSADTAPPCRFGDPGALLIDVSVCSHEPVPGIFASWNSRLIPIRHVVASLGPYQTG